MAEKCPTCFGTGRRPDTERAVCMFCGRTTRDAVKFIFATDGPFGLVAICNICVREADQVVKTEEAKHVPFKPGAPHERPSPESPDR